MIDFLIIGARRCGTSWTHWYLRQHPEIYMPASKEFHFWHKALYKGMTIEEYNECFSDKGNRLAGEATPAYGRMSVEEIQRVYDYKPDLKFIYIIRNPIELGWTTFLRYEKCSPPDLQDIVEWRNRDNTHTDLYDFESQLRNWYKVFPKEQICVLEFSDLKNKSVEFLVSILEFLNIENRDFFNEMNFEVVGSYGTSQNRNENFKPMDTNIPDDIFEYFQNWMGDGIKSLSQFLNRDLSHWIKGE